MDGRILCAFHCTEKRRWRRVAAAAAYSLQCGMPKILLVKTSSMGDVIHNLPVVSDIHQRFPGATVDWVVEESFAQIPALHPGVRKTIPVALRRWRTSLMHPGTRQEVGAFHAALRGEAYDYVIDTQGLLKSALITRCARGRRAGYDWQSAREPLSALFYDRSFRVEKALHAVERNRRLAGLALAYEAQSFSLDYGIATAARKSPSSVASPYAVLLHATSRDDKLWQEERWADLGQRLAEAGVHSVLPWASDTEKARSTRLQAAIPHAVVPGTLGLRDARRCWHTQPSWSASTRGSLIWLPPWAAAWSRFTLPRRRDSRACMVARAQSISAMWVDRRARTRFW